MIRAEIVLPDGQIPLGKALEVMKRFHQAFDDAFATTLMVDIDAASDTASLILWVESTPHTSLLISNQEKRA